MVVWGTPDDRFSGVNEREDAVAEKATNLDIWEAEFTKVIGKEMEIPVRCSASQDNVLVFCDALGDNNPLWLDEEYARKGRFGMLTAPPTFLIKVNNVNTSHDLLASPLAPQLSLHDLSHLQAAIEFQWLRPVWAGDRFTVRAKVISITRRMSQSVGASVWPVTEASYFNQRQELVGIIRQTMCVNTATGRRGARPPEPDKPGTVAESADVLALTRKRRGAQLRYWQDVQVGQEMEPLEKGLFTVLEGARWDTNVHRVPRVLSENGNVNSAGRTRPMPEERPSASGPDVPSGTALGPSQQKYGWLG